MKLNENSPAYRAEIRGFDALTDTEVLAVALGNNANDQAAAMKLMGEFGSLHEIRRASIDKLKSIVSERYARMVMSMTLMSQRAQMPSRYRITGSVTAAEYLIPLLKDKTSEVFVVLPLNRRHDVLDVNMLFTGGTNSCVIDPKMVFRYLVEKGASGFVVAHNHPSGNLNPSQADIQITRKLKEGSKLFDMSMLDHIIVAGDSYYSFADEGLL